MRTLAFDQVANGMDPIEAWRACGEPRGTAGVQNIRKRGFAVRERNTLHRIASLQSTGTLEEVLGAEAGLGGEQQQDQVTPRKTKQVTPAAGYRLSSGQLNMKHAKTAAARKEYELVYKEATNEWAALVCEGKCSKADSTAKHVAQRYQSRLPAGYKLTARSLYNAVASGRCGQPPPKRGPQSVIPNSLVEAVADYASLKQAIGDEQRPRQLACVAVAAVKGTALDGYFEASGRVALFLKRVRELSFISVQCREAVDDRRWQYLTTTNLTTWFEGYIDNLILHKFLPPRVGPLHQLELTPLEDLGGDCCTHVERR